MSGLEFALVVALGACLADGADAQQKPTRVEFEFVASRSMLPTTDDAVLLNYVPVDGWPVAASDLSLLSNSATEREPLEPMFVVGYAGLIWGEGTDRFCGQWLEEHRLPTEESWLPAFIASTRVLGQTPEFGWHGFPNSVIEIRRHDDVSHKGFWIDIDVLRTFLLFTTASEEIFAKDAMKLGAELVRKKHENADGRVIIELATERGHASVSRHAWLVYEKPDDMFPARWILMSKDPFNQRTHMWDVFVREVETSREVPTERADILQAHQDVERIGTVGIRDYTQLGEWRNDRVRFLRPGEDQRPPAISLIVTEIMTACGCLLLFRQHHSKFKARSEQWTT